MKTLNKSIAMALIFAILFALCPIQSSAKYDDKSDELPGMVDDGTIIALGAVAAVGVGVLVYVLIKKSKQKKVMSSNYRSNMPAISRDNQLNAMANTKGAVLSTQSNETSTSSSLFAAPENNFMQQVENASKTIPVNVSISPLNMGSNFALCNSNGVQVGVKIRF